MFLTDDSRNRGTFPKGHYQLGLRPVSPYFETLHSSSFLLETQSQKFERVRNWVNIAKTEVKTGTQQENSQRGTSAPEKIYTSVQQWDDCSLSMVSSNSNSILNEGSSMKPDCGSIPTEIQQENSRGGTTACEKIHTSVQQWDDCSLSMVSSISNSIINEGSISTEKKDLDTEPRCELQEEAGCTPNAAKKPLDFYAFAGYARTKPQGRPVPRVQNKHDDNPGEPQLSSGMEREVNAAPARSSGNAVNNAHKSGERTGRLEHVTASRSLSLKRKLHGVETVSDNEKRLRRSHRFAADFEQHNAAKLTPDEFVGKPQASDVKKPCLAKSVEPPAQVPHQKFGKRRPIVIDGCNVAVGHTNGSAMDCRRIQACVNHFLKEGHDSIIVVIPEKYMLRNCKGVANQEILFKLQKEDRLLTCWSRQIGSRKYINCYDDRLILDVATKQGAIIISNDKYRDLFSEEPKWRDTIRNRVLPYRFMPGQPDEIMLPQDPFGRFGPTLEEFLRYE